METVNSNDITDLTKQAPRSPKFKLGGYIILARALDKCRSTINGKNGEYHFDCPVDNNLFGFKGIKGSDFKKAVEEGKSDEEMVSWLNSHGNNKTALEIKEWGDNSLKYIPIGQQWFIDMCKPLGLDPSKTPLFDMLDADDKASFK